RFSPCIPGGLLFLPNHLPLPKIGSPKMREILVFGPLYLAIVIIHFRFLKTGVLIVESGKN
ncbi:MAG TPA: hypothetical protein PK275_13180, partial [Chitinophagaceae bacterium]|nr:hypothetical protein [Chitinophagaceae bacterium]